MKQLNKKLGRIPTNEEIINEVKKIVEENYIEMAQVGKLSYQKKR